MTRTWLTAMVAVAIGGAAAIGVSINRQQVSPARAPAERPELLLLTSLPIIFGESFALDDGGSPALARLEQRYRVVPIGVADAASLKGHRLLLMAHPRAQPAEALVELDQWVRDGGLLLLLADPKLDWPSERPLGDKLRPPPAFADTGLLSHWGLTLAGPEAGAEFTAGQLGGEGPCRVEEQGLVARCRLGRGSAFIIADADFLNAENPDDEYLDLLIGELARLETR